MVKRFMVLALILMMLPLCGLAEEYMRDAVFVDLKDGDNWLTLDQQMIYARENGRCADGMLAFMSLHGLIRDGRLQFPTIHLEGKLKYRLRVLNPAIHVSATEELYLHSDEETELINNAVIDSESLSSGKYLAMIRIYAKNTKEEYYCAECFAWILVGE